MTDRGSRWPGSESGSDCSVVVHRRYDPHGLLERAFSGVGRDSCYSSGGKTEDSLGRACVGPPRDDATAHRTWDDGRRSSSSSSSCNAPPHCLGAVGGATPAMHCLTALEAVDNATLAMHRPTAWGQWAVEFLQCTAPLPGSSGQCNSRNALPHCLGAVGSATRAMHRLTAWGQWAVQLVQCTASLPGGRGQCNSCNALPRCLGTAGSATLAMHWPTALGTAAMHW